MVLGLVPAGIHRKRWDYMVVNLEEEVWFLPGAAVWAVLKF